MKIEKSKHNHTFTQLLKVGIFAMLMIAPLFAACSQLIYVTFNKNAYQSTEITGTQYYTTNEYETNEVNSVDDLVVGNIYKCNIDINEIIYDTTYLTTTYFKNNNNEWLTSIDNTNIYSLFFNQYSNPLKERYVLYRNGLSVYIPITDLNNIEFYFTYQTIDFNKLSINNISASDYLGETTVNERPIQALDNAFYYGVEKMTESPLFNWTQNTALYTGIKAMTDNLEAKTNVIAVLVTYWTILTIIYIIIDIVLTLFTKLTHLLVRSD